MEDSRILDLIHLSETFLIYVHISCFDTSKNLQTARMSKIKCRMSWSNHKSVWKSKDILFCKHYCMLFLHLFQYLLLYSSIKRTRSDRKSISCQKSQLWQKAKLQFDLYFCESQNQLSSFVCRGHHFDFYQRDTFGVIFKVC